MHPAIDGVALVEIVERLVVFLEAGELRIVLENAQKERVHRADVHLVRRNLQPLLHEPTRDARQQFLRGFLGERGDEDRFRLDATRANKMDDALDNRHRLARTRTGNDQERTINVVDDLQFLRIDVLCHPLPSRLAPLSAADTISKA